MTLKNSKDSKLQTGTEHAKKLQPVGAMKKEKDAKDAPGRQRKTMDNVMKSTHTHADTHTHTQSRRESRQDKKTLVSKRPTRGSKLQQSRKEAKDALRCAAVAAGVRQQGREATGRESGKGEGGDTRTRQKLWQII